MQKSFQLSLNISYETSDKVRKEKQAENTALETQITEVDKDLIHFPEWSKKCKELISNLLWSADHTSFNASPPSTPQLSLIMPALPTLFPCIQPSTPIMGLENSTSAGPFTFSSHTTSYFHHVISR